MTGLIIQYGGPIEVQLTLLVLFVLAMPVIISGGIFWGLTTLRDMHLSHPPSYETYSKGIVGIWLAALTALAASSLMLPGCATQPPPPVIVQAAPTPAPVIPTDPYASLPTDVAEAIKHNQTPTLQHGITTVYPYSPDVAYPLNCQKLHVTQIRLRDDETTTKDMVRVGDATRWGTIVSDHSVLVFPTGTISAITVPGAQITIPADPEMISNLAIQTTAGRNYVFNPVKEVKGKKDFTQAIEFYYPSEVRAQATAREAALKQQGK